MSRLPAAFARAKRDGRPALIVYLMAGDPSLEVTEPLALACERGGADVLELGIPFSDPIADGPEIQRAGQRALKAGTRPRDVIEMAARLRTKTEVPLVLMTYMNTVLAMGLDTFAERAARAGIDGVIVPDLSLEESDEVREVFDKRAVDHVQLVAPSTDEARAKAIGRASRGFLYVVARYGTTGTRDALPEDLGARLGVLRRTTSLPLAVGFGVTTADHVRSLAAAGADGVVVGSAIVKFAAEDARPAAVEKFVASLASAVRA
ncbi:MAG: tryptophan synthase subunit alpha [Methanobacteriota archaeon]